MFCLWNDHVFADTLTFQLLTFIGCNSRWERLQPWNWNPRSGRWSKQPVTANSFPKPALPHSLRVFPELFPASSTRHRKCGSRSPQSSPSPRLCRWYSCCGPQRTREQASGHPGLIGAGQRHGCWRERTRLLSDPKRGVPPSNDLRYPFRETCNWQVPRGRIGPFSPTCHDKQRCWSCGNVPSSL